VAAAFAEDRISFFSQDSGWMLRDSVKVDQNRQSPTIFTAFFDDIAKSAMKQAGHTGFTEKMHNDSLCHGDGKSSVGMDAILLSDHTHRVLHCGQAFTFQCFPRPRSFLDRLIHTQTR
jgi:hypothetical protein